MSTLIGLKGSCELQKERYGNNTLLSIPVETIEKLLAAVEAGDDLAFQYEGMLQWMKDTDSECDDQDKLVDVYKAYRKAKAELGAK